MKKELILDVKNLTKKIGEKIILENISFSIKEGEFCILKGENGAGKSMLLKCILALEECSADIIEFCNKSNKNRTYLRRVSGFISDDTVSLIENFTPNEYYEFIKKIYLINNENVQNMIENLAMDLELTSYLNTVISKLSFGTKKKVQFLGTIIYEPRILICDELFEGIDIKSVQKIKDILNVYIRKGNAVLLTTHIKEVEKFATSYLHLENRTIHSV